MKVKKISNLCIRTITCGEENHVDLLLIGEGEKRIMFLLNVLIDSCTILEEEIVLVNFYTLSLQKKV